MTQPYAGELSAVDHGAYQRGGTSCTALLEQRNPPHRQRTDASGHNAGGLIRLHLPEYAGGRNRLNGSALIKPTPATETGTGSAGP